MDRKTFRILPLPIADEIFAAVISNEQHIDEDDWEYYMLTEEAHQEYLDEIASYACDEEFALMVESGRYVD